MGTFEVSLEFHDSSHDHTINPNHINGNANNAENKDSLEKEEEEEQLEMDDNSIPDKYEHGSQNFPLENGVASDTNENMELDPIKENTLPDTTKKSSKCKQPFQGGYFLIILSNGLSNVAFKFHSISFETQPTDVIQSLTVRITSFYVVYKRYCAIYLSNQKNVNQYITR